MIGDFQNGKMHGQGDYKFANGNHHRGAYQNGQKNGHGVCKFANGSNYEGNWMCGCAVLRQ